MGFSSRWTMGRFLPRALRDDAFDRFDQGTQRAILRLYRSSPPDRLATAGSGLAELRAPALVLWGDRDPYIPARFADAYARALGGTTEVAHLARAGHWPWCDAPEAVQRVTGFLDG
jgi:pimeloyl-ACP methyl ester carboxylesterase